MIGIVRVATIPYILGTCSTTDMWWSESLGMVYTPQYGLHVIKGKDSILSAQILNPCLTLPREDRHVALKILTADCYGGEKEVFELSILRHIKTANPDHPGYKHVIYLLDDFRHAGPHGDHVCLVFEVMGEDLVGLARRSQDEKIPAHLVKQIARQLLLGLDYLHRSCMVVHTGQLVQFRTSAC